MSGSRAFIAAFAVALSFASAGTAAAYHTRFVADNCNAAAPTPTSYITRDGSATVRFEVGTRVSVGWRLLERQRPGRLAGRSSR